jgi:hypothetical protein
MTLEDNNFRENFSVSVNFVCFLFKIYISVSVKLVWHFFFNGLRIWQFVASLRKFEVKLIFKAERHYLSVEAKQYLC